jgi:hypothetical protein
MLPGPLRHFTTQLDELRNGDVPDMDRVGRCLAELTADTEFFAPLIAEIPSGAPGDRWLIRPERPRPGHVAGACARRSGPREPLTPQ